MSIGCATGRQCSGVSSHRPSTSPAGRKIRHFASAYRLLRCKIQNTVRVPFEG